MIRFSQFIEEDNLKPGWKKPSSTDEHDEVLHQAGHPDNHPDVNTALKHLSDRKNYQSAKRTTEVYNRQKFKPVSNTDASQGWSATRPHLDPNKARRANQQAASQKSGTKLPTPIILRVKNRTTGQTHEHLLGGNTRASRHAGNGVPVTVIHHEVD